MPVLKMVELIWEAVDPLGGEVWLLEAGHYGWVLEGCSLSLRSGCSLCYDLDSLFLLLLLWMETFHSAFLP